jgi:hypothetical protein
VGLSTDSFQCEICRSRKSRCDGTRPKCRLCTELNAECIYREPGIKLDAGDKLILEHLNRIEGLLQTNLSNGFSLSSHSPAASNTTSEDFLARSSGNMPHLGMVQPINGIGTWTNHPSNISTMPKTHNTAALNLLASPMIRELVSRQYDAKILLQLEMTREPVSLSSSRGLDLSNTGTYVQAYFERVNVFYACVNPYTWSTYYQTALAHGFRDGPESCIVLLVLALGHAGSTGSITQQNPEKEPPGLAYFAADTCCGIFSIPRPAGRSLERIIRRQHETTATIERSWQSISSRRRAGKARLLECCHDRKVRSPIANKVDHH